mmetsp:Transcript_50707/g.135157  ORF Transcript_50707/g.135157 Transcript_50707/m.135157 type:complete len:234 (-) Transcript_50707:708-1409(-)
MRGSTRSNNAPCPSIDVLHVVQVGCLATVHAASHVSNWPKTERSSTSAELPALLSIAAALNALYEISPASPSVRNTASTSSRDLASSRLRARTTPSKVRTPSSPLRARNWSRAAFPDSDHEVQRIASKRSDALTRARRRRLCSTELSMATGARESHGCRRAAEAVNRCVGEMTSNDFTKSCASGERHVNLEDAQGLLLFNSRMAAKGQEGSGYSPVKRMCAITPADQRSALLV